MALFQFLKSTDIIAFRELIATALRRSDFRERRATLDFIQRAMQHPEINSGYFVERCLAALINERGLYPSAAWAFLGFPLFKGWVRIYHPTAKKIFNAASSTGSCREGPRGSIEVTEFDFRNMMCEGRRVNVAELVELVKKIDIPLAKMHREVALLKVILEVHWKPNMYWANAQDVHAWRFLRGHDLLESWVPEELEDLTPAIFEIMNKDESENTYKAARRFISDYSGAWRTM